MVGILPLGIIPGLLFFPWAWVIVMFWFWFLIDPSRWSQNLNRLSIILFYLYTVFCLWGIVQYLWMPFIHQYQNFLYGVMLIFFLAFWGNLLVNQHWKTVWLHSPAMISLSLMTIVLVLMHTAFSLWSGIIMETNRWNAYFVSLIIILSCLLPFQSAHPYEGIPRVIKPLLVVMTLVVLFGQYVRSVQLHNLAYDSTQYRNAAASAIQAGYTLTAIDAVLNEGIKLASQGKTGEAVIYMRSQWEHLPKEKMAKRFREYPLTKDNPFLFLSLFGGRLKLIGDESIVDGILIQDPLQFIVVTNTTIFQISLDGIKRLPLIIEDAQHIQYESITQSLYGMTRNHTIFIKNEGTVRYVPLPQEEKWMDVVLSSSGEHFWAMHARGGIVEYGLVDGEWKDSRELYPALWRETDLAIRLLHETVGGHDVFYVLDQCKGISIRCPVAVQDQLLPKEDLFRFYHPERRIAVDVQRYDDKFVITDEFGQLDMVQEGIGNDFTEWKYSIRGAINFDRSSGMWLRQGDTVALIAYPEANTVIQLKRNGVFEPIAMPQGFRIPPLKHNGWWDVEFPEIDSIIN